MPSKPLLILAKLTTLIACIIYLIFALSNKGGLGTIDGVPFGTIDFLQYYSSAMMFRNGENPYDHLAVLAFQRAMTETTIPSLLPKLPVLMWNPPTIFPMILPLTLLSFPSARMAWLISAVLIVSTCVYLLLVRIAQAGAQSAKVKTWAALIFISYYPIGLSLWYGQSSHILLLGLVGYCLLNQTRCGFWAGLSLSLTLIKPHLLYALYILIAVEALRDKLWQPFLGLLCGGIALLALAVVWNPQILDLYFSSYNTPPIYWQTPTLGSLWQGFAGSHTLLARFLPTLISMAILLLWVIKQAPSLHSQGTLAALIPFSLFTSPYGWQYDHLLLLPCIAIVLCGHIARSRIGFLGPVLLTANIIVALTPKQWGQSPAIWYSFFLFLIAVCANVKWKGHAATLINGRGLL